jgi:predicted transcriptional regulator
MAQPLIDDEHGFSDDPSAYVAFAIPDTEYPGDVYYRFHYWETATGRRLVRYDNAHDDRLSGSIIATVRKMILTIQTANSTSQQCGTTMTGSPVCSGLRLRPMTTRSTRRVNAPVRRAREKSVPRVVSFGSHSQLRSLLTDKRIELIETIMADSPASISALARQVERNYAEAHADLEVLADYRVVAFEREGQARRPYIPYDRIEYSGTITRQPAPA